MSKAVGKTVTRETMLGAHSAPSVSQLRVLETFIVREQTLSDDIAGLEVTISEMRAEHHKLTHESIPEAMQAAGVTQFKTDAGISVELVDVVTASLPKADIEEGKPRAAALQWLRDNKAEGLIKTIVSLSFGKGENKEAVRLQALLRKNGFKDFSAEVGVHPQTLGAFAREALKKGVKLPLKVLGVFLDHKAKVSVPKEGAK